MVLNCYNQAGPHVFSLNFNSSKDTDSVELTRKNNWIALSVLPELAPYVG